MKRIIIFLIILMTVTAIQAQKISHIENTGSWYNIYDENGKKVRTFTTSNTELVAYSESFYIIKQGSFYHTCDVKGKRLHTFAVSSVGEILNATGDTFTSRNGSWVITWDKSGKKLNTRPYRK